MDILSNFLIERGSPGVLLQKDEVRAFFGWPARRSSLEKEIQRFLEGIRGIYPGIDHGPLRWTVLKDRDWSRSWRRFFSPQKIGKDFWIVPPWVARPTATNRKVITIEPGMAFGTGTHPTTRCCLEFIEEVFSSSSQRDIAALDVGTGSGILAIALAKIGAGEVWALDNDATALKAAEVNVRRNRVEGVVRLSNLRLERIKRPFAMVVANLTAETILDLAVALKERVSAGGSLILSGILKPKTGEVLRQFSPGPFVLTQQKNQKEWTSLLLRKTG